VATLLLEAGAAVNAATPEGDTALMAAAFRGHTELVRLLVEKGADSARRNREGLTALEIAERRGFSETVVVLRTGGDGTSASAVAQSGPNRDETVDAIKSILLSCGLMEQNDVRQAGSFKATFSQSFVIESVRLVGPILRVSGSMRRFASPPVESWQDKFDFVEEYDMSNIDRVAVRSKRENFVYVSFACRYGSDCMTSNLPVCIESADRIINALTHLATVIPPRAKPAF